MLIKRPADIPSSAITDRKIYANRRTFIRAAAGTAALAAGGAFVSQTFLKAQRPAPHGAKLPGVRQSAFSTTEKPNSWENITTYNNFYEFGTGKDEPAKNAHTLKPSPWSVLIEGEVAKPGAWNLEDILKGQTLEERVYRLRCVEAWSMVIPWVGFPLADLIKRVQPTSKAQFIEFITLANPVQMPLTRIPTLPWPYIEGLRMDEATHPLAILAVGLYGEVLPNQNGAPIRLVVPWKYGFKSAKSIVRMRFVERRPITTWQREWPEAYGFYANVNPAVEHPNWDQDREIRLPGSGLYAGMDLTKNY
jgi:sulfoxide reductase catalytic subunit YedY